MSLNVKILSIFGIDVNLSGLRKIDVDARNSFTWVRSGAILGEIYVDLCLMIDMGGHFSGGGFGPFATDHVDLTSMDGELFWAISRRRKREFGPHPSHFHNPHRQTLAHAFNLIFKSRTGESSIGIESDFGCFNASNISTMKIGHLVIKSSLAHIGSHALLKMLQVDNFMHADMHPGNILVRVAQTKRPSKRLFKSKPHIVLLDVGMTAELSKSDRVNLLEFFKAVSLQDGQTAAECTLKFHNNRSAQIQRPLLR